MAQAQQHRLDLDGEELLEMPVLLTNTGVPSEQIDAGGGGWFKPWSEEQQARWASRLMPLALSRPHIESIFWREHWDPQDPPFEGWEYPVSKEDIETFKERGYFIPPIEELEYRGACILTVEAYLLGFENSDTEFLIVRPLLDYYEEASAIDNGDAPSYSDFCFNIWDINNDSYDPANDMHGCWGEIYDEVTSERYGILTKL